MIFILEDNDERIAGFGEQLGSRPHHVERTVPGAIEWLGAHGAGVTLYCLDNDLYVPDFDGDPGEGWQLCEWLLANATRQPIIVHSTNSNAATRMEQACVAAGWELHRVAPYLGMQWIGESWIEAVRRVAP